MYDKIRPKYAQPARVHGLLKIYKVFENILSFCPVIDTTGTKHYWVDKYLSELLNPLFHNDYSLKDSFDAATRISRILPQVRENDAYMFIVLGFVSLFRNVRLNKTINIILNQIYNEKQIPILLSKRSLKKFIIDTCQKATFSFNSKMYEQLDGLSVLANMIMIKCEKVIVVK